MKGVTEQQIPANIIVEKVAPFLPTSSAQTIHRKYAGISTIPDIMNEIYGSKPSCDVFKDNP